MAAIQFKRKQVVSAHQALNEWASRAATAADLVVLPEMAASGYVFENRTEAFKAAELPEGPTFQALSPVAVTYGCWVVAGFPERDKDRLFNSALIINPKGELAFVYRKTLLFETDETWATPGDSGYRLFDTKWGSFTVGICMDLNDDQFVQWCARQKPGVLAFPTNWVQEDGDVWSYWAWRMHSLSTSLVAANTYGSEGGLQFSGQSIILDQGNILSFAPVQGNSIIWGTVGG